jgi:hypothetical protein
MCIDCVNDAIMAVTVIGSIGGVSGAVAYVKGKFRGNKANDRTRTEHVLVQQRAVPCAEECLGEAQAQSLQGNEL